MRFFINLLFALILIPSIACYSESDTSNSSKNTVNVLTWWGYLNHPEIINSVENQCGVKLSFDEYYSNEEFLRRWREKKNYSVIIFSNTIYPIIKKDVAIKNSPLRKRAFDYAPIIKNHYFQSNYPPNVIYYIHSLTGFLWNSEAIKLTQKDSISDIFEKAKNNYIIFIDDPTEELNLFQTEKNINNPSGILTLSNFHQLTKNNNRIFITNDYSRLYENSNFAFSFIWSGDAIDNLKESHKKLLFMIHPKLSYISTDLLAVLNNDKETLCVANSLTSKANMAILQNKDYYFSPYLNIEDVQDNVFKEIYKDFLQKLPKLSWLAPLPKDQLEEITKQWDIIKLNSNSQMEN